MRISTITFMQTFPTGNFSNQKLAVEVEIEDPHPSTGESNHDAAMDAFKEAKELVNTAFKKMNPGIELTVDYSAIPGHPMNEATGIDKRVEAIIGDIELCASVNDINAVGVQVGLIAYESAANSDPRIKAVYDLKMIQLKQKL